ncbi:MAG: SAM-dependent methyltransferase, partial [Chlorobi bacterium]|nr:SAM-dependent methyltransferase [Chlorobiota bacterium]
VEECQFDTIYHEHFSYLSFFAVKRIFENQGLEMFDVEEIPTHGGSLRIYAKHKRDTSKAISLRVWDLIQKEKTEGIDTLAYYQGFQARVEKIKYDSLSFLIEEKRKGKKIIGYGAAAKGNTLINYCGIKGTDMIEFVVDASPYKQGKFLPGSHIPVVSKEKIAEYKPDYVIILPWNLKKEISGQLDYIREWGGKFVIFIPELTIF